MMLIRNSISRVLPLDSPLSTSPSSPLLHLYLSSFFSLSPLFLLLIKGVPLSRVIHLHLHYSFLSPLFLHLYSPKTNTTSFFLFRPFPHASSLQPHFSSNSSQTPHPSSFHSLARPRDPLPFSLLSLFVITLMCLGQLRIDLQIIYFRVDTSIVIPLPSDYKRKEKREGREIIFHRPISRFTAAFCAVRSLGSF